MKKIFSVFFAFVIISAIIPLEFVKASAHNDEYHNVSGDYLYKVVGSEAYITGYYGDGGNIIIPSQLGGYPVTKIAGPDISNRMGDFYHCTKLTGVTIPKGIRSIEPFTFSNCKNLTKVSIAHGLKNIGDKAFDGCAKLGDVSIPASVESIGFGAFHGTSWIKNYNRDFVVAGDQILINYKGTAKNVSIPKGVKTIGIESFSGCKNITEVTIPDSVIGIGKYAFSGCSKLVDMIIPQSVSSIDSGAFSNCSSLKSVIIPNGVKIIRDYTFSECSSLNSVTIPAGVKSIGSYAFSECKSLKSITVPTGVKSIGGNAFLNCAGLKSVKIPNSVTKIECHAFSGTFWLKNYHSDYVIAGEGILVGYKGSGSNVVIPDKVKNISDHFFDGCSNIKKITIPGSIKTIGFRTFGECKNLTEVVMKEGVTQIDPCAFYQCTSLSKISIPSSVTSIGYRAFDSTPWLENCSDDFIIAGDQILIGYKGSAAKVTIPEGIKVIGEESFSCCKSLVKLIIPGSVKKIEKSAFSWCSKLTIVKMPNSITNIEDHAFTACSKLVKVEMSQSITDIGDYAFSSCYKLTKVEMSNSIMDIGDGAFCECRNIIDFTIPDNLKSIGESTFEGCEKLTVINLPKSTTKIGKLAFNRCVRLREINVDTANPKYSSLNGALFNKNKTNLIQYPCSKKGDYIIPKSVIAIADSAFAFCSGITEITIPGSVKDIGYLALNSCKRLANIVVDSANESYSSKDGVLFNKSETYLIQYPCGRTGYYSIPNGVKLVAANAFQGCNCLKSVSIPDSVKELGLGAFQGCKNLKKAYFLGNAPDLATGEYIDYVYFNQFDSCAFGFKIYYINGNTGFPIPNTFYMANRYYYPATTFGEPVTSIQLNTNALNWPVGKSETLKVTLMPENATSKALIWKSADTRVATVDSNGKVTAVGTGKTTIACTATGGNKTATCSVVVSRPCR